MTASSRETDPTVTNSAAQAQPDPHSGAVVLLVEDEAGIRALVRRVLERRGHRVHAAEDGKAGLELASQLDHIDILITDVVMPRMYGTELAGHLCLDDPDLPVLFISGYTTDERLRGGKLPPRQAFLEKPFSPATFVDAVHELLYHHAAAGGA